jgi:hypothetical protein
MRRTDALTHRLPGAVDQRQRFSACRASPVMRTAAGDIHRSGCYAGLALDDEGHHPPSPAQPAEAARAGDAPRLIRHRMEVLRGERPPAAPVARAGAPA